MQKESPVVEDPVEKALKNYSIITANPWAPDVPCVLHHSASTRLGHSITGLSCV